MSCTGINSVISPQSYFRSPCCMLSGPRDLLTYLLGLTWFGSPDLPAVKEMLGVGISSAAEKANTNTLRFSGTEHWAHRSTESTFHLWPASGPTNSVSGFPVPVQLKYSLLAAQVSFVRLSLSSSLGESFLVLLIACLLLTCHKLFSLHLNHGSIF